MDRLSSETLNERTGEYLSETHILLEYGKYSSISMSLPGKADLNRELETKLQLGQHLQRSSAAEYALKFLARQTEPFSEVPVYSSRSLRPAGLSECTRFSAYSPTREIGSKHT